MSKTLHLEQHLQTLGGRVTCKRCQALSKRTGMQCQAPAISGKSKCRFHGGLSTGAKTQEGRLRCAQSRWVHGNETSIVRIERSIASAKLALLESVGFEFGIMSGPRSRGPKPHRMAQVLPELHALAITFVRKKNRLREQNTVHRYHGTLSANLGGMGSGWGSAILEITSPTPMLGSLHHQAAET